MSDQATIEWTKKKRDHLRKLYDAAVVDGRETFKFEGHLLVVAYAKYLLQYLDMKLEPTLPDTAQPRRWRG